MSILDPIRSAVAATSAVVASAIALLDGLKSALEEALADDDLDAVAEIVAEMESQRNALAAAVLENTPAAAVEEPTESLDETAGPADIVED